MSAADSGATATLGVVVSPGVSPYLVRTLQGLAEQTRPVDLILVVDTSAPGREIGTGVPMDQAIDAAGLREVSRVRVVRVNARRTFGAAVRAALADHAQYLMRDTARHGTGLDDEPPATPGWLWLLHDDSAPEPRAHDELRRAAESGPSIAIAGPKQRDWARPDRILEAGLRATATARRVPEIEDGEIDQGQHDSREDVLAVGTAGALVRRSVWDELGGPDPTLGPYGDGLDLSERAWLAGYRVVLAPGAVVHHARASFSGLRDLSATQPAPRTAPDPRRSFTARRRSQLFLWLVSVAWYWVPLVVLAILVLAPLRALWRLATKELSLVGGEMRAAAEVLARPRAIWRARQRRRRTRRVSPRYLRTLRASWRDVSRAKRDERRSQAASRVNRVAPSELELRERAELARRRRVTVGIVLLGLTAIALVAFGPLLVAGALHGGALAAIDTGLPGVWQAATSAWVTAGLGHAGPPDPLLAVLALLMLPLAPFGADGNVLTTALVVLGIPLAGVGAWFAAGAATRSVLLRAWATVVWAVAPTLLLAAGQGRVGALVAHLALPWVALGLARAVGVQRRDVIVSGLADANRDPELSLPAGQVAVEAAPLPDRGPSPGSITAGAAAGLALAVATAGAPALLPAAVIILLVLALIVPRRRRLLALVALPPVLLLGPLLTAALQDRESGSWRALLATPGVPVETGGAEAWLAAAGWPARLPQLLGWPAPWDTVAALAGGGVVVLVAVLALLRGTGRARAVRAGWVTAVVGLALAVLTSRTPVAVGQRVEASSAVVHGWGGPGVSLTLLGLLVAAVAAGDGMRQWLTARSFGWRQLTTGLVGSLMVLGPALTTGAWLTTLTSDRDADPALQAVSGRTAAPVPALARELQTAPERSRVLALHADGEAIRAEIWRRPGPQLTEQAAGVQVRDLTGDQPPQPTRDEAGAELDALVAQLTTGTAEAAGEQLGRLAVGVVLVPPAAAESAQTRQDLISRLDATAGLDAVTENESGAIWRTGQSAGQSGAAQSVARVRLLDADGTVAQAVPSSDVTVATQLPAGGEGRRVVLAERADNGWRATYNGQSLRATTEGWRQAFELPAHTGYLEIDYTPAWQRPWQVVQAVGLGIVVLLALPLRRRREETVG